MSFYSFLIYDDGGGNPLNSTQLEYITVHARKNQCIPHFVKVVELLRKPVISTVFPHCGIVFFHSNSTHYTVTKVWKYSGNF